MPANLSPEYKDADREYRVARTPEEKLRALEKMLATIPKHKGTEKMQADLKRRISQMRDGMEGSRGKKGFSVTVEAEGAAQVAIIGAPNAGKSALVEACTNARVQVADFPFSTREPAPGMLSFEDVQFQLVDLPPVCREYMESWVSDIVRNADCGLWVCDAAAEDLPRWLDEVEQVLSERKIRLVGGSEGSRERHEPVRRLPTLIVAQKMDEEAAGRGLELLRRRFEPALRVLPLSAMADRDFARLGRELFDLNRLIRVYAKPPGKEPDRSRPFVLRRGDTLLDFARLVHKELAESLDYARVWGQGKFDGQRIMREQELADGDVVELHA
jgi:ribosome-interacting GTPase 1